MTPFPQTAVTRLFGTRLPIVAGGLMWLANADYVAACARAGMIGFVTAASFPDDDALRAEIRRTRDLAGDAPFGVNVSMLPKLVPGERNDRLFRLIAEEGVRYVETSGRSPEPWLPMLHEAGITVLHKVPALRYAQKAQEIGVDAVAIVGAECGGHPGMEMVGSMVNAALAARRLTIPWLLGGGIGSGDQIIAALAMGASGVVIGTRFLVADEIPAHPAYKDHLTGLTESDTTLSMHSVRNTVRTIRNETTQALAAREFCQPPPDIAELLPMVSGQLSRAGYQTGDTSRGLYSAGQSLGLTNQRAPLAGIVSQLCDEARAAQARICGISVPASPA